MIHGKSIRIFLADGSPTGIRYAELINWTGHALVCPRARIGELKQWQEADRPGLYILFGEEGPGIQKAYIGETENVIKRLKTHLLKLDFWDKVVLFTSKDNNLTKSHAKYLESRVVDLATRAGRYKIENGNVPQSPSLPRSDCAAMEEYIDHAKVLLGALGFPLMPVTPPTQNAPLAEMTVPETIGDQDFHFKGVRNDVDARGRLTDEGFLVYADSLGPKEARDSLNPNLKALRDSLFNAGTVVADGNKMRFVQDVMFTSPSAAAGIVCGGAKNGRKAWKNADGKTLRELEEAAVSIDPSGVVSAESIPSDEDAED